MKVVIPGHAKISKEAILFIQDCLAEFIGFLTSEANDSLKAQRRKTLTGEDLVKAMAALGFDNYLIFLRSFQQVYKAGAPKRVKEDSGRQSEKRGRDFALVDESDQLVEDPESDLHSSALKRLRAGDGGSETCEIVVPNPLPDN
eukprot:CAMPEP_0175124990 /NCGR_PEP_ID=MMETSP0087-20121206/3076_1 /TAXON_ID=136419 /ORGANISM="Unknown Unknown, Strain D1" /LENGTH=143 /DNA_ID=CAMNT_0016406795 /DNA_START=42 /DNA_END=473 /DNA_ORIENTATION=+